MLFRPELKIKNILKKKEKGKKKKNERKKNCIRMERSS